MGEACKGRRCLQDTGPVDQLTETAGELEIERHLFSGCQRMGKGERAEQIARRGWEAGRCELTFWVVTLRTAGL